MAETLTVEHGGQPLSRYDVRYLPGTDRLREVTRTRLFETSHALPAQPRLFRLADAEWLKALKLDEYAPRAQALQGVLFPYLEAL